MATMQTPVPASALTVDGKPGIKVSFAKLDMSNINNPEAMKPVATRIESTLDAGAQPIPARSRQRASTRDSL